MSDQPIKHAADAVAGLAAFGSFFGYLMNFVPLALSLIASILSIIWLVMQMRDRAERKRRGDV